MLGPGARKANHASFLRSFPAGGITTAREAFKGARHGGVINAAGTWNTEDLTIFKDAAEYNAAYQAKKPETRLFKPISKLGLLFEVLGNNGFYDVDLDDECFENHHPLVKPVEKNTTSDIFGCREGVLWDYKGTQNIQKAIVAFKAGRQIALRKEVLGTDGVAPAMVVVDDATAAPGQGPAAVPVVAVPVMQFNSTDYMISVWKKNSSVVSFKSPLQRLADTAFVNNYNMKAATDDKLAELVDFEAYFKSIMEFDTYRRTSTGKLSTTDAFAAGVKLMNNWMGQVVNTGAQSSQSRKRKAALSRRFERKLKAALLTHDNTQLEALKAQVLMLEGKLESASKKCDGRYKIGDPVGALYEGVMVNAQISSAVYTVAWVNSNATALELRDEMIQVTEGYEADTLQKRDGASFFLDKELMAG